MEAESRVISPYKLINQPCGGEKLVKMIVRKLGTS